MTYSESELDSTFVINSVSDFDSDSEFDFGSVFMNLDICIFLFFICNPLNKPADDFFYPFS